MEITMKSAQAMASLVAIVTALSAAASSGQQTQAPSGSIKRTADGTPNLAGVWQSGGVSLTGEPGSRPPLPPPAIPPPPREPIPYQPWAAEKNKQLNATDDPIAHCLLPGVPRIITMPMPLEIVQTPTRVVILYEAFRAYRIIPINDQLKHPDDLVPTWLGDSVGRWEGDSLIVDVIGFNDKTWLGGGPSIHSEDLHVVERYRLAPDGTIAYQATVEDPKALTKPWITGATLRTPPNTRVEEYECIENNQDIAHMPAPTGKVR
jgi:hypothetical protein